MLVVSGREKEILNLGGDKVKPEVIEEILTAFGAIGQAAVFTVPNAVGIDEVWARVVPTAAFDENALRMFCQRSLPVGHVPVRFITVDSLPRNDNGKIERHRLRDGLDMIARR